MRFMDECAAVISHGQLVQIYPEAQNTPDGNLQEFKKSYIVIAYRAGAPIVPIITDGNYGLFKRARVIVGKEIDISSYITSNRRTPTREELETINNVIFAKVKELRQRLEEIKAQESRRKK